MVWVLVCLFNVLVTFAAVVFSFTVVACWVFALVFGYRFGLRAGCVV